MQPGGAARGPAEVRGAEVQAHPEEEVPLEGEGGGGVEVIPGQVGQWSQCTKSCGSGQQHRVIQCIDLMSPNMTVVGDSLCQGRKRPGQVKRSVSPTKHSSFAICTNYPSMTIELYNDNLQPINFIINQLSDCDEKGNKGRMCEERVNSLLVSGHNDFQALV